MPVFHFLCCNCRLFSMNLTCQSGLAILMTSGVRWMELGITFAWLPISADSVAWCGISTSKSTSAPYASPLARATCLLPSASPLGVSTWCSLSTQRIFARLPATLSNSGIQFATWLLRRGAQWFSLSKCLKTITFRHSYFLYYALFATQSNKALSFFTK